MNSVNISTLSLSPNKTTLSKVNATKLDQVGTCQTLYKYDNLAEIAGPGYSPSAEGGLPSALQHAL